MTKLYCHTATGFCLGCKHHIVTQEEHDSEIAESNVYPYKKARAMLIVAEVGDELPSSYEALVEGSWLNAHLGWSYGGSVGLEIEPDDSAACWMHADSCLVSMMFKFSVIEQITKYHTSRKTSESICEQIFTDLNKLNLKLPRLQAVSTQIGAYYGSLVQIRCTGRAKAVLCLSIFKLLDYVFPLALRRQQADAQVRYENFVALWKYYIDEVQHLINQKRDLPKEERAGRLEVAGKQYMCLLVKAHKSTSHLYPHVLKDHMGDMIRRFKIDIYDLQLQSAEHINKDTKFKQKQGTNCKKSHNHKENVVAYTRVVGGKTQEVKASVRNSGPMRISQVVQKHVLSHALDRTTPPKLAVEESRLNAARKASFAWDVNKKLLTAFDEDAT
jgi:hypothetical protein